MMNTIYKVTVKFSVFIMPAVILFSFLSCSDDTPPDNPPCPEDTGYFARGADVSWVTKMESEGIKFYDRNNNETECMKLLRDVCGVNSIRLRVWVNPEGGWNGMDDVVAKARRAHSLGMRIMIDFHYSDTWADPGHQITPAAWAHMDIKELCNAVSAHTSSLMLKLKEYGIEPFWVQVGNETRDGMLYPLGKSSNGQNFADLVNAGYDAVKSVFPAALVIVHLDSGDKYDIYKYIFDILRRYNGRYDMIGMSLYPDKDNWRTVTVDAIENINTLHATYGKPVMICEVGMKYNEAETCRDFIALLMDMSLHKTGMQCMGIFYWEPEAPAGYNGGYDKGCFAGGKPTVALEPFKK